MNKTNPFWSDEERFLTEATKSLTEAKQWLWTEVNSNNQTVNNSGGPEEGEGMRGEPRIFQYGSSQALAGLACHLSPDKGIRQFCSQN